MSNFSELKAKHGQRSHSQPSDCRSWTRYSSLSLEHTPLYGEMLSVLHLVTNSTVHNELHSVCFSASLSAITPCLSLYFLHRTWTVWWPPSSSLGVIFSSSLSQVIHLSDRLNLSNSPFQRRWIFMLWIKNYTSEDPQCTFFWYSYTIKTLKLFW